MARRTPPRRRSFSSDAPLARRSGSPSRGNISSQDYDGTPTIATPRTAIYPNDTLIDQGSNVMRVEPPMKVPYWLGGIRYSANSSYCNGVYGTASDMDGTADTIYYSALYVPQKVTVVELGYRTNTACPSGKHMLVGIYSSVAGLPTTKLAGSSALLCDTADTIYADTTTVNVILGSGWYYLAVLVETTGGSLRGLPITNCMSFGDNSSGGGNTSPASIWIKSATYGSGLPSSASITALDAINTAGPLTQLNTGTIAVPQVWVKTCEPTGSTCSINNECCSGSCSAATCT
jgi:hypothetical protein